MKHQIKQKLVMALIVLSTGSTLSLEAGATEHAWVKPGASLAAGANDRAMCARRAEREVANVDYASPVGQSKFNRENLFRWDKERAEFFSMDSCMHALGYRLKSLDTAGPNGIAAISGSLHF